MLLFLPSAASEEIQQAIPAPSPATGVEGAESDDKALAHRRALELAGAFSNDGFRLRDGRWTGRLTPGEPILLEVQLLARNQYWFSAGISGPGGRALLGLFDEWGNPVETLDYRDDTLCALGFSPSRNGTFFLLLSVVEGDPVSFCVVYSYK